MQEYHMEDAKSFNILLAPGYFKIINNNDLNDSNNVKVEVNANVCWKE